MTALTVAPASAPACPPWCAYPDRPADAAHVSRDISLPLVVRDDEDLTRGAAQASADELEFWPHLCAELIERDDTPGPVVMISEFMTDVCDESYLTLDNVERLGRGLLAFVEAARAGHA